MQDFYRDLEEKSINELTGVMEDFRENFKDKKHHSRLSVLFV